MTEWLHNIELGAAIAAIVAVLRFVHQKGKEWGAREARLEDENRKLKKHLAKTMSHIGYDPDQEDTGVHATELMAKMDSDKTPTREKKS